jgi:hypothetical protein
MTLIAKVFGPVRLASKRSNQLNRQADEAYALREACEA